MSKSFKFLIISFFALLVFSCGIVLLSHDFSVTNNDTQEEEQVDGYGEKVKTANVTYDRNDGSGGTITVTVSLGGTRYERSGSVWWTGCGFTLASNTFSRNGYNYVTWNTQSDGGGTSYSPRSRYTFNTLMGDNSVSITFYAQWSIVNYSLSYTLNSGTVSGNPTSYNVETNTFTLKNPTRTGYTFTGWSGTGISGTSTSVTVSKGSTGNRSYTANWEVINYSISYNLNDGSASNRTSYNVTTATFTLNNPTKTGYTFKGWSGTGISGISTSVSVAKGSTGNRSYTANWIKNSYNISYNLNGGTHGSNHPDSATYDDAFQLSNPTRTGYTFDGWTMSGGDTSTAKYGTSEDSVTESWSNVSTKVKATYFKNLTPTNGATVTLTANWSAKSYTITFNPNKPSNMTSSIDEYLNGTKYTNITQAVPNFVTYDNVVSKTAYATANGWTFNGFYTASSGGLQVFDASGNPVASVSGYTNADKKWRKPSAVTLYAHWTANKYGVTLDENKPLNMTSSVTQTLNNSTYNTTTNNKLTYDSVPSTTKASATGWIFNGYFTASSGGSQVFDASGNPVASVSGYTNANGKWTRTSDAELYAQWTAKILTITLSNNSATITGTSTIYLKYDDGYYLDSVASSNKKITNSTNSIAIPTKNGVVFDGYYTSGGTKYIDEYGFYKFTSQSDEDKAARSYFSANGTLHAHYTETWAKDSYILAPTLSGGYYQIASEANLAWLMVNVNSGENIWKDSNNNDISGAKQTANIDLSAHKWFPIGTSTNKFATRYNGQGYQISGLETHADVAGLFGYVSGRVINVYLSNSTISGKSYAGGVVGDLSGGTVSNCVVYNSTVSGGTSCVAGGVVGKSIVAISNCAFVYLKDTSNSITGGTKGLIVGQNSGTTADCVAATKSTTGMNIKGNEDSNNVKNCLKKIGNNEYVMSMDRNGITTTTLAVDNGRKVSNYSNIIPEGWKEVSNMFISMLPKGLFWIANW